MNDRADDPRVLAAASALADGAPVDWAALEEESTADQAAVLRQLKVLSALSPARGDVPTEWGPYPIVGLIGRGAFGRVYHAIDPDLRRDVALKVVAVPPRGGVNLDAALEEGRLLARLDHPNVVHVYRADRIGDEVGIAMELVKGTTLETTIKQQGPLGAREAAVIGLDLCHALAALHGAGTLHGDLKAHNVMRATGGRTVLMDLGAGRDLADDPGPGGDFAGTPVYLAPEVFAGESRTRASDIYSLGVLLYYLVSGSYPVDGPTTTSIERQHRRGSYRLLRDRCPDLPDAFVRAVERALADRPEDRHASAGTFEIALARVLGDQRRALPTKALAVAAALLIAAAAGTAVWYRAVQSEAGNAVPAAPPTVPVSPMAYTIEAALYAERDGAEVRLPPGARVAPGDRLSLQITTSAPVHLYVVNEDERGESYLLFPLPGQGIANPLAPGRRYRLPSAGAGQSLSWRVTSAGGREHFLIFANPQPSEDFEAMFASLAAPTLDASPQAVRLTDEALGVLRGVGGLAQAPQEQLPGQLRLARDFATPLVEGEETVRGVWVRQVTLENPVP